jgi:superfamily II DNA or RNA helicase
VANDATLDAAGPRFDGDANQFRLAAEALRLKYAALYDPMVAVNSSDLEPLPHQIRAVYSELLPQTPLRYLLADDPGAGKTIMAGLYLKESMLRSDCERAIIVAPGGLVEQWREELASKFDLRFEVFSRRLVDDAAGRNVFAEHPYLIARMDQLSRDEDLQEQLRDVSWDVAVVDEAHRMSAHYWGQEMKETKRFQLGKLLSETAQNFLLMTATPHAGKEDDFQLFMSLLDADRFEGQFREGVHHTDTTGLMIRRTKEELLTFEGKPLFPERRAYTVAYELSEGEKELYEQVTDYVRTEMGKADQITAAGEKKRGGNIGFALTVLQRRLASSPEAILRSLERRRTRLQERLQGLRRAAERATWGGPAPAFGDGPAMPSLNVDDYDDLYDDTSEDDQALIEEQVEQVVDLATAARTVEELGVEIGRLDGLIATARQVRRQDSDEKWVQLRAILQDQVLTRDATGSPRKIIVFTEHRDTLDYLSQKIGAVVGHHAIVTIHGGVRREDRKLAREQFTDNPNTIVLLATDAAGEGLNLQRAHLMVNYDLPWNPNRIEQRFGRIHRIGQREVCQLWNLVAQDTREGAVFQRLLDKITEQGKAYNGNLFNVLGDRDAFRGQSLKDLVIEAIRYGDQPEVRARLDQTIDASYADGVEELLRERALHPEMFPGLDLDEVRRQMEQARERKLQPGYIRGFFIPAFRRLGGMIRQRETGRYQIGRVPQRVQDQARRVNRWRPLPDEYERVTFETRLMRATSEPVRASEPIEGLDKRGEAQTKPNRPSQTGGWAHSADAALIAPGHPLLQAVIDLTIEDLAQVLSQGAVFVDRRETQTRQPSLLFALEQRIETPAHLTLSHHFDYVALDADGDATVASAPPYLDYDAPEAAEAPAIAQVLAEPWIAADNETAIKRWAYHYSLQPRRQELVTRIAAETARVRAQVIQRLNSEVNHWDREYNRLAEAQRQGKRLRMSPETALAKARQRELRLTRRLAELDQSTQLVELPAHVRGQALVIPSQLLAALAPAPILTSVEGPPPADRADIRETEASERRAVDLVLAAERALGRAPEEMDHYNPGYDIRSTDAEGRVFYIEVKGYLKGAREFEITNREVATAQNQGDRHRLALVAVDPDDPALDELRYIIGSLDHLPADLTTTRFMEKWAAHWERGGVPR